MKKTIKKIVLLSALLLPGALAYGAAEQNNEDGKAEAVKIINGQFIADGKKPENSDTLSVNKSVAYCQTPKQDGCIQNLPHEVLAEILSYLDPTELGDAGDVCRYWRDIASNETLKKQVVENNVKVLLAKHIDKIDDTLEYAKKKSVIFCNSISFA